MAINITEARDFLRLLTGSDDTPVTFQVFYDPKGVKAPEGLAQHWVATLDDSLEFIEQSQSQYCGVYVGVNESDGRGRENANIVRYRCVFADFDGMEQPQWSLTPHFVQQRDETHGHAFWLVSDITTPEEFKALQKRIAIHHGCDEQVTDPARVVRLAGSHHYKNPQAPAMYTITDDNTDGDFKYTIADIESAFTLTAQQDAELTHWVETRGGILDGTGYELNERYIEQFSNWLASKAPVAITGSGSHTVFKVSAYGHDHGIPLLEAQDIMWNVYNPRCEPPWEERDRQQFYDIVERGYKYTTSAAGCKTAVAAFSALPPLPEPIGGWEENAKLKQPEKNKTPTISTTVEQVEINMRDNSRYDRVTAASLLAQLNNKSPHYDLAKTIDGMIWNGEDLIRCKKIFYIFNGKIWSMVDDDVIKATIQRTYAEFKPSDTFVRGVLACLCDLVNVTSIQNGTWLNGNTRNPDNIVIFENGIVDLSSDTPVLEPHDRNFFSFNMRNYSYTVGATCPSWMTFLASIWGDDEALKMQLQEFMGYLMTDSVLLQKFAIFMGISRGGKGVLTNIIREMVGVDNTVAATLSNLTTNSTLESMSTKSLALIPDAHSVSFNNRDGVLSNFKAITGGDPMSYHVMYKGSHTSILKTRFILSTNNMPEFVDSSGALANRMLVFPFTVSFAGKGKANPNLFNELHAEIEGISQWALAGLKRLRLNNGVFTESQAGLIEKEEIREDMFPLAQYVNSMCEVLDGAESTTESLFAAYKLWCTMTGFKKGYTEIQFSKTLRSSELHLTKCKVNGVRGFRGIRLNKSLVQSNNVVGFHK